MTKPTATKPIKTGQFYALPATDNTIKLGVRLEDGTYQARYVDGPAKGGALYLSRAFMESKAVVLL